MSIGQWGQRALLLDDKVHGPLWQASIAQLAKGLNLKTGYGGTENAFARLRLFTPFLSAFVLWYTRVAAFTVRP